MENRRGRAEVAGRPGPGAGGSRGIALAGAAVLSLSFSPGAAAEVTKTLQAELTGSDVQSFAVENLAGTMRIVAAAAGTDPKVSVIATVHAENDELANGVRLERVPGDGGTASLRVRYPEGLRTIRYREPHRRGEGLSLDFFSYSSVDYDGRSYRVAPGHGKRVWADLEVRVPARVGRAQFRNLVGLVEAEGVEGSLKFDVASADLELRRLTGQLSLDGSSGDIRAQDVRGSWSSDFSSGDLALEGFDGQTVSVKTSSGDVRGNGVKAARFVLDTSSGDLSLRRADLEEFEGESSSGDLRVEVEGSRLKEIRAHTSSGDVSVRLPRDASFEAAADQSSGDMSVGFTDGASTLHHDKLVAYRRGTGVSRIRVETSSGDFRILPD